MVAPEDAQRPLDVGGRVDLSGEVRRRWVRNKTSLSIAETDE